jgi:hypothetical protein
MTHPGSGFKVADAYADFHIDVDSEIGRAAARLKAKGGEFARMGESAGKAFSAGFARGVDLDKGMTRNIEALRKRTNQLERMGNQAGEGYSRGFRTGANLRSALVEQLAVVRSSRPAFAREGKQAGDAYARAFGNRRLSGPAIGGDTGGAEASGEATARAMARGLSRGGRDIDTAAAKNADRINARFSAIKFLALSQGMPAAATAGFAATAGIIGGAAALFIGLGAAGQMSSEKVQASWVDTGNTVQAGIKQLSGVYESRLVAASDAVEASFVRSTGLIRKGMVNASGGVDLLVESGITLAENALPGIVTASGKLTPVLLGVRTMAGQVGAGFSEMAVNASQGNVAAGKSAVILGDALRTTEARVGSLVANLANASGGPLNSFRYTLDQITGAALDLTAKGSGALGFFQGFSTTANGAVTVARGLLGAINALPPQVTALGGAVSATSMILSKVGIDAGKPWEGLGAKVRAAGADLAGTEKFAAKAGTAVGSLAAGALNPATLAVGALSIGLLLLGDRQEKAAAAAAEHRENVRALTDAIRQDNGALGEHSATVIANALASKNASNNLQIANITMAQATVAANGNQQAMRQVTNASNGWIQSLKDRGIYAQNDIDGLKGINQQLLENGGSYESVATQTSHFTESLASLHPELQKQLQALFNGTGAIGEQAKAAREAYSGYLLQEQGLTGLTEAQIKARDATIDHTKAIYEQQNANLGYRGAVQGSKEAVDAWNKVVKDGKVNSDEGTRALLTLENAFGQQEQAAYNAAYANSTAKTEQEKVKEATIALNRETVSLANSFNGPLPASLAQTVGKMSVTEAKAAGLTVAINNTGQAVYRLPDGREIRLTGNNQQALDAIQAVQNALNAVHNKEVTLRINQTTTYSGTARGPTPSYNAGARYNAAGNLLFPRGGDGAAHPVQFFAGGGLAALNPLSANRATVVAPNTWRVVGDNMRVPELFAPLNGSRRTADLIMQAAEHEGLLSAANEALAASRRGQTVHEDFSFTGQSANMDRYNETLAAMMFGQTHADAGSRDFQAAVNSWLQGYVAQQTAVVRAIPSAIAAAVKDLGPSAPITVQPPPTMDYDLLAEILARKIFLRGR